MKQLLLLLAFIYPAIALAQADKPPYLQFAGIPPFEMRLVPDSSLYGKKQLQKKRPLMIMLFSPDCDHCQQAVKLLLEKKALFKKIQVVMVSALPFEFINQFYLDYHLAGTGFKVGRDGSYFLGTYFQNRTFPSYYLYNKKGNFIKMYDIQVPFEKMAEELKE